MVNEARPQRSTPGSLGTALLPWLAPALLDVYMAMSVWPRPPLWQCAAEIALLGMAGRSQWKVAWGWMRTSLLPAAVLLGFVGIAHPPEAIHQIALYTLGLVVGLAMVLRAVATRWTVRPVVAAAVAAAVVLGGRWLDTYTPKAPWLATPVSVFRQLFWSRWATAMAQTSSTSPAIVVLSVDTLRSDAAMRMRTMERLAARGASWERAMSTSSWTLPALASLQTGLMPAEHGAGCLPEGCQGVADGVRLLAEDLHAKGYATAAVVTNPWVTVGTSLNRGFDVFVEPSNRLNRLVVLGQPRGPHRQDASHAIDAALRLIEYAPDRGFYLWVHLLDPHLPYFHSDDEKLRSVTAAALRNSLPLDERSRESLRRAYAGEVAYVDAQLGRLLDALERRGILNNGVVVFTSDHGEEFWEHGGVEHGHSHHGEVIDVPLVLVAPGVPPGVRDGVASLVDVVPTIRSIVGLPTNGIDLRHGAPPDRVATAWGGLIQRADCSARSAKRRAIARDCTRQSDEVRLYELTHDPTEQHPLVANESDALVRAVQAVDLPPVHAHARVNREALEALGYLR